MILRKLGSPFMASMHKLMKSITIDWLFISLVLFDTIAIIIAIAMGIHKGNAHKYFGETTFITWISVLQLWTISVLSYRIFQTRRRTLRDFNWRAPFIVWLIISLGFLYLGMDDLFKIHESIDHRIHNLFQLKETGFTDRFDDMIVGVYGLIGIIYLRACREEIKKYRQVFPFLTYGFVLLFIMVALDILTNRTDILEIFLSRDLVGTMDIWLAVAEDSAKVFSGSFFLVGFYGALQIARRMDTKPAVRADS
jgi:hypothetical protein